MPILPDELTALVDEYQSALQMQTVHANDMLEAKAAVECRRTELLLAAYANGAIDGKNEAARKLQESAIVESDNAFYWLSVYQEKAALTLASSEIAVKVLEAKISLTKAWLYTQRERV